MDTIHGQPKAVVFDWGGTIMANLPYSGPMASWPEVVQMPAVSETLQALSRRYRLALATNAQESDAGLVIAALARAGLDGFFERVFTPHELNGCRKPQAVFFHAIQKELGICGSELVMVGDDALVDAGGAVLAGWRSVWYNPDNKIAPGCQPPHDAEIQNLGELPALLSQPFLPGVSEARFWLCEQHSTPNLLVHIDMVACLSYLMAVWLRDTGQAVDPILAHRGGMLHDLAKISARNSPLNHGEMAARLLEERGQPVLARIAVSHMLFNIHHPEHAPHTWEEKIVYYADKLVEQNQVVSMELRLRALRERYSLDARAVEEVSNAMLSLEREIAAAIGCSPAELVARLQQAFFRGGSG